MDPSDFEDQRDGFDDIDIDTPLTAGQGQLSSSAGGSSPGAARPASITAAVGQAAPAKGGAPAFLLNIASQPPSPHAQPQQPTHKQQASFEVTEAHAGKGSKASRPASFSLMAASGRAASNTNLLPPQAPASQPAQPSQPPPPVSSTTGGTVWRLLSDAQAAAEAGDGAEVGDGARSDSTRRSPLAMLTSQASVPMCTILFSVVSGILAVVFFILFIAHHDQWEETGCTLLLTAASAAAGPASLTLTAVRDPATLVCLGKEDRGPQVTEDSLAALLRKHPRSFADAQAQLTFTPAGGATRWGISLEVKGITLNTTAGTATIQVEDWEVAAAADSGTVYPGTEAFEAQFGAGAPLGQPLLVLRLDDDGLAVGLNNHESDEGEGDD